MIWLTSDTHYGHANILEYCQRDFPDIQAHDEALIAAYNKVVRPNDTVYHLGDFTLGGMEQAHILFVRLHGNIHVLGNPWHHDKRWLYKNWGNYRSANGELVNFEPPIVVLEGVEQAEGRGVPATLCHYAMLTFERSHYSAYHFFGHSHNWLPKRKNCLDVGVDSAYELLGEYRPFSINEAISISHSFPTLVALDAI